MNKSHYSIELRCVILIYKTFKNNQSVITYDVISSIFRSDHPARMWVSRLQQPSVNFTNNLWTLFHQYPFAKKKFKPKI